jgi:electron transport complex protein RnfB
MEIMVLFISLASMGGLGVVLSLILVVADKKFAVQEDPRVEKAIEILPGANCGACGYAGCAAYANALVEGKVGIDSCKPGGTEVTEKLAALLGVEKTVAISPKVARVFCSGGVKEAKRDKIYTGIRTCTAAHLIGGEKACIYSCIGYGDCVSACPFDAIQMRDNGLPVVDLAKCTGCGECVKSCPRNIIGLTDYDEVVHVYCRSRDKGPVVRNICTAGCIACKLCERDDDTGAVSMDDNLSVVNHEVNKAPILSAKRCPTKVIRISEPAPGYEALFQEAEKKLEAAVREEEEKKKIAQKK